MNESMPGIQVGSTKPQSSHQTIEASLRQLWDKMRMAAELIASLRRQKAELTARVSVLERELATLRTDAGTKDQEIKRLRAERAQLLQSGDDLRFSEEEKEILKGRIRELIAKINSHL